MIQGIFSRLSRVYIIISSVKGFIISFVKGLVFDLLIIVKATFKGLIDDELSFASEIKP